MHFKHNLQAKTAGILEQITLAISYKYFHMQALRDFFNLSFKEAKSWNITLALYLCSYGTIQKFLLFTLWSTKDSHKWMTNAYSQEVKKGNSECEQTPH